jgi:hypothetical protein
MLFEIFDQHDWNIFPQGSKRKLFFYIVDSSNLHTLDLKRELEIVTKRQTIL